MNTVTVSTTQFQSSHGREPRGTGCWFFFFEKTCSDFSRSVQFTGTYSACKKQAVEEARRRGETNVYVGP